MSFDLLTLELHRHSQSWISVLTFGNWHLFYIEWDYERKVQMVQLFGFWL